MMNRKKAIKGICFVIIFIILFMVMQKLLQAKWGSAGNNEDIASTSTWTEFHSLEKNTVDVLFLGTSHVYCAVDPMYIYDKTGITSFVFGGPGLRMDLTYLNLEDCLKTQKPSVVFLDMSAIQFDFQQTEAKCHKVSDQFPITLAKIEYAFNNGSEEMKPLDVLFPFFRYHSRWSDLEEQDFKYLINDVDVTITRGHRISYDNKKTEYHFYEEVEYVPYERNIDYIKRMQKLCDENDVELILYKIPTPTWYESQSKGAQEIGDSLGLTYLEPFYDVDKMGLDPHTDFRDKNNHMNQYGAEKFCDYLIDYMQDNFELEDHRSTNLRWDKELKQYKKLVSEEKKSKDKKSSKK